VTGMPMAVLGMDAADAYRAGYEAGFAAGLDAVQAAIEDEHGRALAYLDDDE